MKNKQLISWGILVGVALIIAILSYFATWVGDDMFYMFSCVPGKEESLISSFSDIIESQNAHYFIRNGRYVAHCLVQAFCGIWGQTSFAIVNGIVYILFFRALIHLCGIKMSNTKGVLIVVLLGLITFQTRLAPAYQIGYIWTFTFMMAFLSMFFKENTNLWSWWKICILGVFSLLAGNGQEALGIGIGAALILHWLSNMKNMTIAQYVMMVCFGIGALICCLSPAIINRAGHFAPTPTQNWSEWIHRIFIAFHCVRAFYFLVAILTWKILRGNGTWAVIYKSHRFYWDAWMTLLIFNGLLGFPGFNRPWFGMELLSIIIGIRLVGKDCFKSVWLYLLSFVLVLTYAWQIKGMFYCRMVMNTIESQYSQSTNGKVYVNLTHPHRAGEWEFSEVLCTYHVPYSPSNYQKDEMRRLLNVKYPGREPIQIIPTYLKGKENDSIGNKLLDYGSGVLLAIQSKTNPYPLCINRCINILGYKCIYEPLEIAFDEKNTLCEGKYWRACLIEKYGFCLELPYLWDADLCFGIK